MIGFRAAFRREYPKQLRREAMRHTTKLNREATRLGLADDKLTLEVHGDLRANAYMDVGWHPISVTYEAQQWGSFKVQVPIHTLQIERWP